MTSSRRPDRQRAHGGIRLVALGCGALAALAVGSPAVAGPPGAVVARPGGNPPADGFNRAGSDAQAVALADSTMAAMGGRAALDQTRYLVWRFFDGRLHIWDKFSGREHSEYVDPKTGRRRVVLMNLNTKQGQVFVDGTELSDATAKNAALQEGLEDWINDSYWLLMPYKLKDSGVTLRYKGVAKTADGQPAEVLVLTFQGVGVTPQNKYEVYIAKDTGLVAQWSYYEKATDPRPEFTSPWQQWRRYGRIMLSSDRGKDGRLTDLAVLDSIPESVFSRPEPVELKQLGASPVRQ